ncbi:MAG TPA: hypothetical protein VHE53_01745 [Patescibacteria group bacterium]|nr:hypothetical protein [Patescibacteria group bacterium]
MTTTESLPHHITVLNGSKYEAGTPHTPAATEHYSHAIHHWDTTLQSISRARAGDPDGARSDLEILLSTQDETTGFIPNMTFLGKGRWWDPERLLVFGPKAKSSDYSQPPIIAMAMIEIKKGFEKDGKSNEADEFARKNYDAAAKAYRYFANRQAEIDNGNLITLKDPHESGRDSDHVFDDHKWRLPYDKVPKQLDPAARRINGFMDYSGDLLLGFKRRIGIKQYGVKDVMFNCIYAENLHYMAKLAEQTDHPDDAFEFSERAKLVEAEILEEMWNPQDKKFYPTKDGLHIEKDSVGDLFPLILNSTEPDQVASALQMIDSPEWYKTEWPLPSIPVHHANFDPDYKEPRIWRGPVWVNMNWYVTRGLQKQAARFMDVYPDLARECYRTAWEIAKKTKELTDKSGYREFYNPHTGEALRPKIRNFAWSTLSEIIHINEWETTTT